MIITFYSYKGGVGRSMALANVADRLSAAGLDVLMIDFDLEAPGLEHYFPVNTSEVQEQLGLIDFIYTYMEAMSIGAGEGAVDTVLEGVEDYIMPIYRSGPSRLDLMSAGRRARSIQLENYASRLRSLAWDDFYMSWGGQAFFEWLRRYLRSSPYDVTLIDSRTGLTELGGICTYQLADLTVVLTAANQQNIEGTADVVDSLHSSAVVARLGRPRQPIIVVPARIDIGSAKQTAELANNLEKHFANYVPDRLAEAGVSMLDLAIPYDSDYALSERISGGSGDPQPTREIERAYDRLVRAIATCADQSDPLRRLVAPDGEELASRTYDPTMPSRGFDAYVQPVVDEDDFASELVQQLRNDGLSVFDAGTVSNVAFPELTGEAVRRSASIVLLVARRPSPPERATLARLLELTSEFRVPVLIGTGPEVEAGVFERLPEGTRVLAPGSLSAAEILRSASEHRRRQTGQSEWRSAPKNPYVGLRSFSESDRANFYGRESLVAHCRSRLIEKGSLALVGASGSGKSSVLAAGLVPMLRSDGRAVALIRPGPTPVRALIEAVGIDANPDSGSMGLANLIVNSNPDRDLLIAVDQLEELFTLTEVNERARFATLLTELDSLPSISLVVALRADFVADAVSVRALASLIQDRTILVPPMTAGELERAIVEPAMLSGVAFEAGLVQRLVDDFRESPSSLPLLQMTLARLFEERDAGFITHDSFDELGGGAGAAARIAEDVISELGAEAVEVVQRLLLSMVRPGERTADVRAPLRLDDALRLQGDMPVLEALTRGGLVVVNESIVEIAHEAIIDGWPRLRRWIEENRERLRVLQRLRLAANEWEIQDRPTDLLYRGVQLASSLRYFSTEDTMLGTMELEFVRASQAYERSRGRRQRRTLVAVLLALTTLAVLAARASQQRALASEQLVDARVALETALAERPGSPVTLIGLNLGGLDLAGVDLSGAVLDGSNLAGSDLSEADLSQVSLRSADLTEVNLTNASLRGADLTGSRLEGAILTGADLADAILDGTVLDTP